MGCNPSLHMPRLRNGINGDVRRLKDPDIGLGEGGRNDQGLCDRECRSLRPSAWGFNVLGKAMDNRVYVYALGSMIGEMYEG